MNRKPAAPTTSMSMAAFNKAAHEYLAQLRAIRLIERLRMETMSKPRDIPAFRNSSMVML